jgi:hypothetical protein
MDNSPDFASYPKRSRSLICTTDDVNAEGYADSGAKRGRVYAIFPVDGTTIAFCPKSDIWETEVSIPELKLRFAGRESMSDFNWWIEDIAGINPAAANSWTSFTQAVKTSERVRLICEKAGIDPAEFVPMLQRALSPKNTGFTSDTINSTANPMPDHREVWFSGDCIAITYDIWKSMVEVKYSARTGQNLSIGRRMAGDE